MFVVDANVLVYAADVDSRHHVACRAKLETWQRQAAAWFLTWGIVYEFLRITTHPQIFRQPWTPAQSWMFVEAVVASPSLGFLIPTERHVEVTGSVMAELPHLAGNIMHEAETAVLMREHGIKVVYTRDMDFHRFPFLEPIDPIA